MGIGQQQLTGKIATRDLMLRSSTLKQGSLSDKIDCAEVSSFIYDVIAENQKDDARKLLSLALKVRKFSLNANLGGFVNALRKYITGELIDNFIEQLIEKYTTEEQRKAFIQEVCEIVLDPFPGLRVAEKFSQILNKEYVTEEYSNTSLHLAAEQGNLNAVKYFVEKGGDISAQDEMGYTPLHLAAKQGNLDIVKYFVEKGADVDAYQGGGSYSTVLHLAAQNSYLDIVKYLIEKGANPNAIDGDGKTPLQRANEKGISDIVEYLAERVQQVTEVPQTTERQQFTEVSQVTEEQQATTEVPQTTERQQVTTEISQTTEGQQFTEVPRITERQQTTERQQVTTKVPQTTEGRQVTTEVPQATEEQQVTETQQVTEVPRVTERQQVTTEAQQVTEVSQATEGRQVTERSRVTEVQKTTEGQQVTEDYSNTSLHLAAEQGNLNAVKYFVERGADINAKDKYNTPLHLAAQNGYLDIVKYLIDKGADISIKNLYNTTPLHLSAQNGHLDIVKYFIDRGADFTSSDSYDKTSLFYAAESGNLDLVKYLIEKGASINVEGRRNDISVLPYAAESGNLDLVKYLVEKGANINAKDYSGYTSLHRAVFKGKLDIVKYFVEKGAYVNVEGGYSRTTPLYDAAIIGNLDIAKYLIANGANLERGGFTTLLLAIKKGDLDLVKYLAEKDTDVVDSKMFLQAAIEEEKFDIAVFLIDKGADITVKNRVGYTILHQAAEKGSLDLVKHLVEKKGMDVNIKSKYNNRTSLHLAAESGNLDLVKYLVEKGAHINVDYWIGTPLHTAVSKGNLEVVKYLVNAGANVNMKDGNKNTPLHLAAKNGNLGIVKYLIEKGADSKAIDSDGKTPLDWAAQDCRLDIVEHLTEKGQQATTEGQQITEDYSNTFSYLASEQGNLNKEGFFVEKGKDKKGEIPLDEGSGDVDIVGYSTEEGQQVTERPRVTCEPDNTSLHSAAKHGELDRVKCLIEKGADINAKDESGLTPLHQAAIYRPIHGSLDVVKYLVENGADINVKSGTGRRSFLEDGVGIGSKSKTGRTPLHYAAIHGLTSFAVVNGRITGGCLHGNLDLVKYLVKKGADLTARDEDGKTPLDLAKSRCNPQVVEFLSSRCRGRSRRDLASNSLMNNNIVNWVKGLISSTESPGLLTSREHNNHTVTAVLEINTTVVNNTIMLGILATGLFNKTQHKQPIHENLLSPREQSTRLNNIDENMIIKAIQQGEEKFSGPNTDMDGVKISGNKTGMWKRK